MTSTRSSNIRPKLDNEIIIRGYELLNFSDAATNQKFLRPDMYKIVEENEDFDINYVRGNESGIPVLFLCSRSKLGIQCSDTNYSNFEIIEKNCPLNRKCSVIVDGKPGTITVNLSKIIENMKVEHSRRTNIYNSLSMDYTFMELSTIFKPPKFATEFDLGINNWPDVLKLAQIKCVCDNEVYEEKIVPMTWNYCSISAKGSFTDFHIDFAGSCVWISIIFGRKTWWIIPPTEYNIRAYELYLKDTCSTKDFFGYCAADCCRITLTAGQSFYLPAGWIHAVYTNEDTLMIGGNFITAAALKTHLNIVKSERRQKAEEIYTYPYFNQLMWYTVAATVYNVTGINFVDCDKFKRIDYVKKNLTENLDNFFKSNERKLNLMKLYLKNPKIEDELKKESFFLKNRFKQQPYENIVQREKINNWTENEAQGYKSLLNYIKQNKKLMKKNVPIVIEKENFLIDQFEKIINVVFDNEQNCNMNEKTVNVLPQMITLSRKCVLARKRKINEKKNRNKMFLQRIKKIK